jgi:translation initiation factor 2B subunit (eIF-2B alpha/beta/delta family)
MRAIERIMTNNKNIEKNKDQENTKKDNDIKNHNKKSISSTTKYIPRIKIDKIHLKDFENEGIYLIYGKAEIKKHTKKNKDDSLKFSLTFKQDGNIKFTILLSEQVNKYLKWDRDKTRYFIVCGKLIRKPQDINMVIFNSNHFKEIK